MSNITVLATSPIKRKIGSEVIKLWQRQPYSHIAIVRYRPYFGLSVVYQASHGMVHQVWDQNFFKDNEIVRQFILTRTDQEVKNFEICAIKLTGIKYGKLGLIILFAARIFQDSLSFLADKFNCSKLLEISKEMETWGDGQKTMHCSELAAILFPEITQYSSEKNPDRIEPVHIIKALEKMPGVIEVK